MVVKMMTWRPWPPLISKKYNVNLTVHRLEGFDRVCDGANNVPGGLAVEIGWKGPKKTFSRSTVKRNCTREETVKQNGDVSVEWDEEFCSVCNLTGYKDNVFNPWEMDLTLLGGLNQGLKNKLPIVGSAILNLSEYVLKTEEQLMELKIPLSVSNSADKNRPLLYISLSFLEQRDPEPVVQIPITPLRSPSLSDTSIEKDDVSSLKFGLEKVQIFNQKSPKYPLEEEEGSGVIYPFDSDSLEQSDKEKENCNARKSFSYGTLAYANCSGSRIENENEDEDLIYYTSHRKSDVGFSIKEDSGINIFEAYNSRRSILPWKKRKLNFRSPKGKGEPLLKKDYGEEGGDDIDFDRRQLSSDESISSGWHKNRSSFSEFGDDNFSVGTWEHKEITSRDGYMKIQTEIFFASIDQRNERAAGESACTSLVTIIADWLQKNPNLLPIKSQFDTLIRDGSLEWRKLCENEIHMEKFPDKHFDLETVLEAKTRDLIVLPEKSFIGFFGDFEFLDGAMSFENIWEAISRDLHEISRVFIVSWNDHFFVLKVEKEAYYIIDTLGERLHEGCDKAYILKFDKDTAIFKLPSNGFVEDSIEGSEENSKDETTLVKEQEEEVFCRGKESFKEYIKSFLAAIPIRELQDDMKKGLINSTPLHQRLQIEFSFTQLRQ